MRYWPTPHSDANYNAVAERTKKIYAAPTSESRTYPGSGRWAIASLVAGLIGAAFLPSAMIGGGDWMTIIENVMPLWMICCLAGLGCGIRALQFGRRASVRHRMIAAAGAFISLLAFIALTLIAMLGGQ